MSNSPVNPRQPSSAKGTKTGSKRMTRAAVTNLNRQKSANESQKLHLNGSKNVDTNVGGIINHNTAASPANSKTSSSHKSLPPQPSTNQLQVKSLPDVPEFYIVRPAPSTSRAKIERNDQRVFINRGTMEKINVSQGGVVLIHRHNPVIQRQPTIPESEEVIKEKEEDYSTDDDIDDTEQATVGLAWPMNRIEPNGTLRNRVTNE
jgi:hypothetical protein